MDPNAFLHVSSSDPTPPYEQLRRQLAELIGSGHLPPEQRLPPVRQLAADLGLAPGTVARTYRELESAGLVITRRGGGTRVATDTSSRPNQPDASELQRRLTALVRQARYLGVSDKQIREAVDAGLDDPAPRGA